jgi:hypothetical protein
MERFELKDFENKKVAISLANKIFSGTLLKVREDTSTIIDKYGIPVLVSNKAILSIHAMRGFGNEESEK